MSISLEARDILMQLNSMGYRNITAEQLKEFIKGKIEFYKTHTSKTLLPL